MTQSQEILNDLWRLCDRAAELEPNAIMRVAEYMFHHAMKLGDLGQEKGGEYLIDNPNRLIP